MKTVLGQLHHELLADLKRTWQLELPEMERIESCYHVTMNYWTEVKEIFKQQDVYDEELEIEFFKSMKPVYTSYIEYYLILHQALLFLPENPQEAVSYWEEELKRYNRYCDKHADFIKYFESYSSEYDAAYFTIRNNRQEMPARERIYEDEDCRSTHDHVVRGLMANSMYNEFVREKLKSLGDSHNGSVLKKVKLF